MAIELNGTTGITTPDITSEAGLTVDGVSFASGAPANTLVTTSGGNVGIGTSSPSQQLHVNGTDNKILIESTDYAALQLKSSSVRTFNIQSINDGSGALRIYDVTAGSERARIDSSGNFMVGTTSALSASIFSVKGVNNSNQQPVAIWNPGSSGTRYLVSFATDTTYGERGYITWNGSTMALSNASDERLKENIVDAPSALPKIEAMQIRSFDFKADGRHVDYGVIAQELNQVIPESVFEGIDKEDGSIDKPWSVGLEPIIPVLIKAVQEQQALITAQQTALQEALGKIETLEARVAALEAA